jgi:hypothetical protein
MKQSNQEPIPEPVNHVLAEQMLRLDLGERVDRERFLQEHPDVADRLRDYFEDLDAVTKAMGGKAAGQTDEHPLPDLRTEARNRDNQTR